MFKPYTYTLQQVLLMALCLFLLHQTGVSQKNYEPDSSQNTSGSNAYPLLTFNNQLQLYNGREHTDYLPTIKGDAYYLSDYWQDGSVNYDGVLHRHLPLMYDIVKDLVIIKYADSVSHISLVSEKVKEFWIGRHHFIRLQNDSADSHLPQTGFYEQLYNGTINLLAKRKKVLKERIIGPQIETSFESKDDYYAAKDGRYYALKNKRSFLDFFGNRKKDIQQYLRKNRIKFNKNSEEAMVKAAAYYDTLKQ